MSADTLHRLLKWIWPALFTFWGAVAGILLLAEQPAERQYIKDFNSAWLGLAGSVLTQPWAWGVGGLIFLVWLWAFICSGRRASAPKESDEEKRAKHLLSELVLKEGMDALRPLQAVATILGHTLAGLRGDAPERVGDFIRLGVENSVPVPREGWPKFADMGPEFVGVIGSFREIERAVVDGLEYYEQLVKHVNIAAAVAISTGKVHKKAGRFVADWIGAHQSLEARVFELSRDGSDLFFAVRGYLRAVHQRPDVSKLKELVSVAQAIE